MRNVVVKVYYENFHIRVPFYDTEASDHMLELMATRGIENWFLSPSAADYDYVQIEEVE